MSKTSFVLALLLGMALSAASAQEAREKGGRPAEKSPATRSAAPPALPSPVPGFVPAPDDGASPSAQGRKDTRIRQYAAALMRQYDKDKNGLLEKEEWQQMPDRWLKADRNGDGTITLDELTEYIAQKLSPRAGYGGPDSLPPPPAPPEVRALPPAVGESSVRSTGEMPRLPATSAPAGPSLRRQDARPGERSGPPEVPVDPRAPLVSIQLVMAELVPEAAKAGQKPQAQAAPDLAKGPATLSLDLSAPDEKLLEGLHKQGMHGRLDVLYRIQLTTADQQNASFQFGQSQPQITSVSQSQFGQSNSVTMNRTGMTLEIQPRVAGSTVSMKVNLEGSRLGRAEEGVPLSVPSKGESVRVPPSYQVTLKTAVNVPDGQTIALGGLTEQDGPRKRQLVVLVCPRVIPSVNPRHPDRPAR